MTPALPRRGFQWDLARQPERLDWMIRQLPRYADWGYQELYLHLEDAVEYPSLPGVARPGAYSRRQLSRLVDAAGRAGIGVVPIVNLLGHTQYLVKVPELRDLNELRAPDGSPLSRGQICPLHPRTLAVAEALLRDVRDACTTGLVHVGLDESYALGRHPRSRSEIARIGVAGHFARHVGRLHGLARSLGLRLGLWADMLALLPDAIPLLPRDVVAYDWYYYPFGRLPRIELRNFAPYDLAGPLRARGIGYWGCPMDGAFRHEPLPIARDRLANIASWWARCRRTNAAGMLVTSWEPQRLCSEIPQAIAAAAAGLWLDGEEDPDRLLESGARRMWGRKGPAAARALRSADKHPFSGYDRWQVNDRWDTVLVPGIASWRAEARALARLAARPGLPPAVGSSLRFRSYLADRDLFVRSAAQAVWRLRGGRRPGPVLDEAERAAAAFARSLARGRAAARAMWRRTRDPRARGPNEAVLGADERRLSAWRQWLRRCRRDPGHARTGSPVAGAWQLLVLVGPCAPAAQKVVVERRRDDGTWEDLHGIFLIDFRADRAGPDVRTFRFLSVPIDWSGPPGPMPGLRIAVRGFGRAGLPWALLTDGRRRFRAAQPHPGRAVFGRNAPARGYPDFDWERDRGAWRPAWTETSG
jgi:hypothetical protein